MDSCSAMGVIAVMSEMEPISLFDPSDPLGRHLTAILTAFLMTVILVGFWLAVTKCQHQGHFTGTLRRQLPGIVGNPPIGWAESPDCPCPHAC